MKLSVAKKYFLVFLLALMFSAAYLLPYIKYVFYEPLRIALNTTNEKIGLLLTIYAIMNTITLIPGGWVSDKYSMKKIIVISSVGTGLLNLILAFNPTFYVAAIVWLLLGFTTIFAFWGAVIKAVRLLGDESEQGKLYGFYAGFQGLVNTIAAFIASYLFNKFSSSPEAGLKSVLFFYAVLCILAAVIFYFAYPKELDTQDTSGNTEAVKLSDVLVVLKMPATWILSLMIFSIYGIFSGSTYFTPYVKDVIGITGTSAAIISIFRTYIARSLFSPVGGFFADKTRKTTSNIIWCSAITAVLILVLLIAGKSLSPTMTVLVILLSAVTIYMNFGVMWAVSEELDVPRKLYGTVIGVASIIGYCPDLFMHTLFGNWLDSYGDNGYHRILLFLIGLCLVGIATGFVIIREKKKHKSLV